MAAGMAEAPRRQGRTICLLVTHVPGVSFFGRPFGRVSFTVPGEYAASLA